MVSGRVSESHMASKEPSMDKASKEKAMEKASKESIMEKTFKEEKAFKQPTMEKASKEPSIEKKPTMKKTSEEKKASKQSDVEKKPTMEKASKEPTTEEKLTMEKKSTIAKASKEPTTEKKPTMDMVSKESTIDKASESTSTLPISSNLRASSSADSSSVESSLSSSITGTSSVKTSSVSGTIRDSVNSDAKTSEGKYRNGRKMSETADSDKSGSFISDSNESISSSSNSAASKPHKTNDSKWEAIRAAIAKYGVLGLNHFKLLKRLGCGDIGSVYLCELRRTNSCFAMKVMDKGSLASRKKLLRAQTEREILQLLDHPFLPTLYAHFETDKYSCLVMEFCSGGDLHTLRQRQPGKYFPECIARFYAAEVLLALEYLHMMGIVYRDLKPENVLVREDGHIMLTDFDLSLRCTASPTLVKSSSISDMDPSRRGTQYCVRPPCVEPLCIPPSCIAPPCIRPNFFMPKRLLSKLNRKLKNDASNQATNTTTNSLPELMVEPIEARSMSFVGTHEYLAPEIIKGEGHGSAVDWWTFGVFLYELLHGKTPFKGDGNRATLFNVVGQPLKFPESPSVSFGARDLIRGLMVKDPKYRLASKRGAVEIRQHPFFEGVNWALIRSMRPPEVPRHFDLELARSQSQHGSTSSVKNRGSGANSTSSMSYLDFEF